MAQFADNVLELDAEVKKFMANRNPNIQIPVNASDYTLMTIGDLVPFPGNHVLRKFTTDVVDHSYQNLKESIKQYGLNDPIHVWLNEERKYCILSGHTRVKACSENGCLEIAVKIIHKFEGKHYLDPTLREYHRTENVSVPITDISQFYFTEHVCKDLGLVDKDDGSILDVKALKKELKSTRITHQMYMWIHNLKYGRWHPDDSVHYVEAQPRLIKDLEEGKKSTGVQKLTEIQWYEHRLKYDPDALGMPRDPELEKMLNKLDKKWMIACKEMLDSLLKATHPRYPNSTPLANADTQFKASIMHYIVSDYLKNEINNANNEFTANAPDTSTPYDIYVYKNGHQVAIIEVKTTSQNKLFSGGKPKIGYHMLVSISETLNMFSGIFYLPPGSWTSVAGKNKVMVTLSWKSVGENKEWMHEYYGMLHNPTGKKWNAVQVEVK
jgi:hypothetical protein